MTSAQHELVKRWNAQQAAYTAGREQRFDAMLDVLELTAALTTNAPGSGWTTTWSGPGDSG